MEYLEFGLQGYLYFNQFNILFDNLFRPNIAV